MTPATQAIIQQILADARLADVQVDTTPLLHLEEMTEDEAAAAIDAVYQAILFDGASG